MVLITVAAIALLVVAAQVYSTSDQRANNWIGGIAALVAGLNVLLTFYLLRTAQRQVGILRDDLKDQADRHRQDQQAQELRHSDDMKKSAEELKNTRDLLSHLSDDLASAREDAQNSRRETAKSRLDLLAPKCSLALIEQ